MSGACRQQQVRGGYRDAGCPTASSQLARVIPNFRRDGELGHPLFELLENLLLLIAGRTVPELQPHEGAPAGGAVLEHGFTLCQLTERIARGLADAPPAAKIVATIGLLLVVSGTATAIFGAAAIAFPPFLPTRTFEFAGLFIGVDQVISTLIAAGAAAGLYSFFRFSKLGVAMRGVVDNPDLLDLAGTSPARVRTQSWIIGNCFAALSGILLAPQTGLDSILLTLLVVQAFGAAAVGAFTSLPLTYLGGPEVTPFRDGPITVGRAGDKIRVRVPVKFSGGEAAVLVNARREGAIVEIAVADSGPGIAPAFLPHVFEEFRQADDSPSRAHGGLGLGLAIARRLGVDASVTAEAERAVPDVERRLDALLADVERRSQELDALRATLAETERALAEDRGRLEARGAELQDLERAVTERQRALEREGARRAVHRQPRLDQVRVVESRIAAPEKHHVGAPAHLREGGRGQPEHGIPHVVGDRVPHDAVQPAPGVVVPEPRQAGRRIHVAALQPQLPGRRAVRRPG